MAVKNSGDGKTAVRDKTKRENRFLDRFSRRWEFIEFSLGGALLEFNGVFGAGWCTRLPLLSGGSVCFCFPQRKRAVLF